MNSLELAWADVAIVIASVAVAFGAGWFASRRKASTNSFIDMALAGRRLTLPFLVASLVATWYGAVLSVGEFVGSYGVVTVLCFGIPYYLSATLYAVFVVPRIRTTASATIPEQIRNAYGRTPGRVAASLVAFLTSPAPYILMAGELVHAVTGWGVVPSMVCMTVVSMAYVVKGGLRSDVAANVVQMVLMFAGFGLLLWFSMSEFGTPLHMMSQANHETLEIPGRLGWWGVLAWWIIALQTFVDPNFHQRASAAESPRVARNAILLSVACWMLFDTLTIGTALYAITFLDIIHPIEAHLVLAQAVLPTVAKGIFFAGILAAVLSTLDGYALVQGITIGRDLMDEIRERKPTTASVQAGLVISGVLGIALAMVVPSVIELFILLAGFTLPGLLLPLLASYSRYGSRLVRGATLRMSIPPITVGILYLGMTGVGIAACMLIGIVISLVWHLYDVIVRGR